MRVKAIISYDGSAFFGFQRQTSTPRTVTGVLEHALSDLGVESAVVGSGRTDRGVHATGQTVHFDLPDYWRDLNKLRMRLNRRLEAVRIKRIDPVPASFHARFDAKKRQYRYIFKTTPPSVFERNYVAYYEASFDSIRLKEALSLFVGEHDFRLFHKTGSQVHSTIRQIYDARYYRYGAYGIIRFEANGFLRSQVRMMVDAAMRCAKNEVSLAEIDAQIACKTETTRTLAPPQGLYLSKIFY